MSEDSIAHIDQFFIAHHTLTTRVQLRTKRRTTPFETHVIAISILRKPQNNTRSSLRFRTLTRGLVTMAGDALFVVSEQTTTRTSDELMGACSLSLTLSVNVCGRAPVCVCTCVVSVFVCVWGVGSTVPRVVSKGRNRTCFRRKQLCFLCFFSFFFYLHLFCSWARNSVFGEKND